MLSWDYDRTVLTISYVVLARGCNNILPQYCYVAINRWFIMNFFFILTGLLPDKMKTGSGDACIDIDHLGSYKIKKIDASAQTIHLIPYRLRFLPGTNCDVKLGPSENSCALRCNCCCRIFSQWILSQVGLSIVVVIWALIGALAFFYSEGKNF